MTQQFKFGDRVRIKDEPLTPWENAGIIFAIYGDEKRGYYAAVCFQESGDFQDVPLDEIERVPHPDTVRLDWLIETCRGIDNNADTTYLDGTPFPQYSVINSGTDRAANWYVVDGGDHDDPRQAIDNAMKAEQQK